MSRAKTPIEVSRVLIGRFRIKDQHVLYNLKLKQDIRNSFEFVCQAL